MLQPCQQPAAYARTLLSEVETVNSLVHEPSVTACMGDKDWALPEVQAMHVSHGFAGIFAVNFSAAAKRRYLHEKFSYFNTLFKLTFLAKMRRSASELALEEALCHAKSASLTRETTITIFFT